MRPEHLFGLFAPVSSLQGVGPRFAKLIEKLAGPRIVDLCWHLPMGLIDRRARPTIAEAADGEIATLLVTVSFHRAPESPRRPYRVFVADESGEMTLIFFHGNKDYLARTLPEGEKRLISGRVELFQGQKQITHPDYMVAPEKASEIPDLEAVYPLTQGLPQKTLQKAERGAVAEAPELAEWLDEALLQKQGWPAWRLALRAAHQPQTAADLLPASPARQRLAYDELLANQLALGLVRARQKKGRGRRIAPSTRLRAQLVAALPYSLTGAQQTAAKEIDADMASEHRMMRLLQGDVGSGKTVVALMAMLNAVEAGYQAALMAPTEILARQHLKGLAGLLAPLGIEPRLITGRDKGSARAALLQDIAEGRAPIVVGTHALFQEDVAFDRLGLVIIDEQHRFGVRQRLDLTAKGGAETDILVMSATPIPRTLTLTLYGDMDVSRLTEKPPGRTPIDTRVLPTDRMDEVVERLRRAIADGAQAYWVCPLVGDTEETEEEASAAEHRFEALRQVFGDKVGLVHGRLKAQAKDAAMARFASGETRLLVATTVIEVGVDVPNASIMVIEQAERFGLAQLHQLRGRVGRGAKASTCLLLYQKPLGDTARARLDVLRETEDGFRLAEEDLRLRGAGELMGTRQSGLVPFRLADYEAHADLFPVAYDDARLILDRDPELQSERGKALRTLLYLFERDEAIRYLRSG